MAAAGREAVQRQEQRQGKAAAAAHTQHTQQEEWPPQQQQRASKNAGNAPGVTLAGPWVTLPGLLLGGPAGARAGGPAASYEP